MPQHRINNLAKETPFHTFLSRPRVPLALSPFSLFFLHARTNQIKIDLFHSSTLKSSNRRAILMVDGRNQCSMVQRFLVLAFCRCQSFYFHQTYHSHHEVPVEQVFRHNWIYAGRYEGDLSCSKRMLHKPRV
jgi:hypothetical protein